MESRYSDINEPLIIREQPSINAGRSDTGHRAYGSLSSLCSVKTPIYAISILSILASQFGYALMIKDGCTTNLAKSTQAISSIFDDNWTLPGELQTIYLYIGYVLGGIDAFTTLLNISNFPALREKVNTELKSYRSSLSLQVAGFEENTKIIELRNRLVLTGTVCVTAYFFGALSPAIGIIPQFSNPLIKIILSTFAVYGQSVLYFLTSTKLPLKAAKFLSHYESQDYKHWDVRFKQLIAYTYSLIHATVYAYIARAIGPNTGLFEANSKFAWIPVAFAIFFGSTMNYLCHYNKPVCKALEAHRNKRDTATDSRKSFSSEGAELTLDLNTASNTTRVLIGDAPPVETDVITEHSPLSITTDHNPETVPWLATSLARVISYLAWTARSLAFGAFFISATALDQQAPYIWCPIMLFFNIYAAFNYRPLRDEMFIPQTTNAIMFWRSNFANAGSVISNSLSSAYTALSSCCTNTTGDQSHVNASDETRSVGSGATDTTNDLVGSSLL